MSTAGTAHGFESTFEATCLQMALTKWRKLNPWADHIDFERFPEDYRQEILLAAHILANRGRVKIKLLTRS